MKKNGFTLVELLAVLVIVSIITLIATPNIVNLMKQSREKEFIAEAQNMVDSAKAMYKNEQKRAALGCKDENPTCRIAISKLDKTIESNDPYGYKYDREASYIEFNESNCTDGICRRIVTTYIKSYNENKPTEECHCIYKVSSDSEKALTTDDIKSKCDACNIEP